MAFAKQGDDRSVAPSLGERVPLPPSADQALALFVHELAGPLAVLQAYVAGAQRRIAGNATSRDEVLDTLGRVAEQSARANAVLRTVRDLVGRRSAQRESLCPDRLLADAVDAAKRELGQSRVVIHVIPAKDCAEVAGQREQLHLALLNVLRNACEATLAADIGCTVTASWRNRDGWVDFIITDEGDGLPGSKWDGLDEPFQTTREGHLGLGLTLLRLVLAEHEGEFHLEPRIGCGTVARLSLRAKGAQDGD